MSSDSQVLVIQVGAVAPHPNADRLDVIHVLAVDGEGGYPCLVKRGVFTPGMKGVFIPVDLVVPDTLPGTETDPWSFLGRHRRIKAKRLRGVFSLGLLQPLEELGLDPATPEGTNVTEILGIRKRTPPRKRRTVSGPGGHYGTGKTEHGIDDARLPPYTDIESLRRFPRILQPGEEVVMTEKVHGACMGVVYSSADARLYLRSRKRFITPGSGGLWADLAARHQLQELLRAIPDIALYGEAYGYVQDLRYGLGEEHAFAVFDARHLPTGRWLDWPEIEATVEGINRLALTPALAGEEEKPRPPALRLVPVLYRGPWQGLAAAAPLAEGKTVIGGGACIREGFVVRPVISRHEAPLGRVILKMVGEGYHMRGTADDATADDPDDVVADEEETAQGQEWSPFPKDVAEIPGEALLRLYALDAPPAPPLPAQESGPAQGTIPSIPETFDQKDLDEVVSQLPDVDNLDKILKQFKEEARRRDFQVVFRPPRQEFPRREEYVFPGIPPYIKENRATMGMKIFFGRTTIERRDAPAPQWEYPLAPSDPVVIDFRGWRPISEAPQDGTWILATGQWGGPRGERGEPMAVRFCAPSPSFPGAKAWRNRMLVQQDFLTHWMPLSAPAPERP